MRFSPPLPLIRQAGVPTCGLGGRLHEDVGRRRERTMSCSAIRPGWNPLSIALMVLGFIVFWPLGLAMLAYILWGDRLKDMAAEVSGNVRRATDRLRSQAVSGSSGNVAFDEYRARELARLEEERRKLDEQRAALDAEVEEFQAFVRE